MPLPVDAQRIFHGRGGLHPGSEAWTLGAYPPVFVLTCFAPVAQAQCAARCTCAGRSWRQAATPCGA